MFSIKAVFLLLIGLVSWMFLEGDEGYFVYLRGKKQYVVVKGNGEPTVVFLTGKGRPQTDFKKIYNSLSKTNRIFSYDRAGLGQSEVIRSERTVDTMAMELHELLAKEKINPPYIFVGHALGSYIMRCFEHLYPHTISGMVFIDPSHEFEYKQGLEIRSDSDKIVFKNEFKKFSRLEGKYKGHKAESKKCFDFDTLGFSSNQNSVRQIPIPNEIPITILIARLADVDNDYVEKEMEYRIHFFENWKATNKQIKVMSVFKSGHFIQNEEPKLVIEEINEVIAKSKIK